MPNNLTLYIPEDCKPGIFLALKKWRNEILTASNLSHKSTVFLKDAVTLIRLRPSLQEAWNHCIAVAEREAASAAKPFSLDDFEVVLMRNLPFKYKESTVYHERLPFMRAIFTALIKSLFIQFAAEPDLYKCVWRLFNAINGSRRRINWLDVPVAEFKDRIKNQWSAFHPLMTSSFGKFYELDRYFFNNLGLTDSDFTKAFFSPSVLNNRTQSLKNCPREIWGEIGSYLFDNDVHAFRQVTRTLFNIVEDNSTLRIRHRLFIITQNALLRQSIGRPFYSDEDYLLCHIDYSHRYRLIQFKNPDAIFSYSGLQSRSNEMIGGKVFKDQNGQFVLLTAYTSSVNAFTIQQLKLASFAHQYTMEDYGRIQVTYELTSSNLNRMMRWQAHSLFKVNGNHVTAKIKFEERIAKIVDDKVCSVNTGAVEHHVVEYDMTDDKTLRIMNTRKCA